MRSKIERYEIMLLTQTKNHYSYPILDDGISSFYHLYNDNGDRHHHQHYLSESSPSLTDGNYLQNQGSNLDTSVEIETKEPSPQSQFIKRILVVDDDPDLTLTFKVGLDNYYYGGKKRFEVYTYNDPLLVLTQFKPHFYDLLLTDIYMPNVNGYQLCEKILELDVNIRVVVVIPIILSRSCVIMMPYQSIYNGIYHSLVHLHLVFMKQI